MKKPARVALLIETSRGHGRQIIQGISRYVAEHGPWSLLLEPRNVDDPPPQWLKNWSGDGLLVRCDSPQMAAAIQESDLPAIDLRGAVPEADLPLVGVDNAAIIETAVEHLRGCGFRHFAYCDRFGARRFWSDIRRERFASLVEQCGDSCSFFPKRRPKKQKAPWTERQVTELGQWLMELPRPVAILAIDDEQGHLILEVAQELGIKVPNDIAVLGIDNDEVFCRLSSPPLSSVDINAASVGYRAAEALAKLMKGRKVPSKTLIRPRGVVVRQSTDIIAVEEPEVAEALRFIYEHACQAIGADEVAKHLSISRSTLDRHLQAAIGQSTTSMIMQVRLGEIKRYLADTDLSLSAIAARTGFISVQHMANLFRYRVGVTPGAYRREVKHS